MALHLLTCAWTNDVHDQGIVPHFASEGCLQAEICAVHGLIVLVRLDAIKH